MDVTFRGISIHLGGIPFRGWTHICTITHSPDVKYTSWDEYTLTRDIMEIRVRTIKHIVSWNVSNTKSEGTKLTTK